MATIKLSLRQSYSTGIDLYYEKADAPVSSADIYVSKTDKTDSFVLCKGRVANFSTRGSLVEFTVTLSELVAIGVAYEDIDLLTTPLFFKAVAKKGNVDIYPIADAPSKYTAVEGVRNRFEKDNHANNAHVLGFSRPDNSWTRVAVTPEGSMVVDENKLYAENIIIDRVLDGSNNVTSELIYRESDLSGAKAKLITYVPPFSVDGKATRVIYSDSVKP